MQKHLFLAKKEYGIIPVDEQSIEIFQKLNVNDILKAEYWKERAYWFHQKLFRLAQIVTDNSKVFTDPYLFIKALQFDVGSVKLIKRLTGEIVQEPKSIKFNRMDEIEFRKLFSDCANVMLANLHILLPGMKEHEFNQQVQRILDLC